MSARATQDKDKARQPVKVFDTFLRGLKRLSNLSNEVELLEEGVAAQEAYALRQILDLVEPMLPLLERPISVREPWLGPDQEMSYHQQGLVLQRSFQQSQGDDGKHHHQGRMLVMVSGGQLVELTMVGSWREGPPVSHATWKVESHERRLTPEFARKNLRPVLIGVLDAFKEALVRGRAERDSLRRRIKLIEEVNDLLGTADE